MATTVQAWGKILHARSKNESIPDTWAVDRNGRTNNRSVNVNALLPISGPKGYGLAMMVDVLSGILLGLPFGNKVSSMYEDLTAYRKLGQLHIVINPAFFRGITDFKKDISQYDGRFKSNQTCIRILEKFFTLVKIMMLSLKNTRKMVSKLLMIFMSI